MMGDSQYLELYFGVNDLSTLSEEQLASGKSKLLEGIAKSSSQEEEISLWIIAENLGIAPPPENLQFVESRIYALTIRALPPENKN